MYCVEWLGPLLLSEDILLANIPISSPAVILLGSLNYDGSFRLGCLLRSDGTLPVELKQYIGRYTHCQVNVCKTPGQAYVLECELYHRLRPKEPASHPAQPRALSVVCPFCGYACKPGTAA